MPKVLGAGGSVTFHGVVTEDLIPNSALTSVQVSGTELSQAVAMPATTRLRCSVPGPPYG